MLSALFEEPISKPLDALFRNLVFEERSHIRDIDALIKAIIMFVKITGPERAKYFGELTGPHSPCSFVSAWNKAHPTQRQNGVKRVWPCPSSWNYIIRNGGRELVYQGEALADGFIELLVGPVIMDCRMWRQLILWLALWFVFGDEIFNKVFSDKLKPFSLRPDDEGLLSQFYDLPGAEESQLQPNIQLLTVYNDSTYTAKHPAGCARLEHVISIGNINYMFNPGGPSILSIAELEEHLITAYNTPQQPDDRDIISLHKKCPEEILSHMRMHLSETNQYMNHTLDEDQWKNSEKDRKEKAHELHRVLNFQRLISFIENREAANANRVS
jgi:hypothetical protein